MWEWDMLFDCDLLVWWCVLCFLKNIARACLSLDKTANVLFSLLILNIAVNSLLILYAATWFSLIKLPMSYFVEEGSTIWGLCFSLSPFLFVTTCMLDISWSIWKLTILNATYRDVPFNVKPFSKGCMRNIFNFCCNSRTYYHVEEMPDNAFLQASASSSCCQTLSFNCCWD